MGFEGSSSKSDQWIRISTEWLDQDGRPLPVDLPGYTARIAKITSNKTLGDTIAEFPIKPGSHLEWLNIPGDAISNDHYYLHVNGKPPEDSPDFSLLKVSIDPISNEVTTETAGPGLLQYRPRHYVPIKVALFDEAETRRRQNQQRQAEAGGATHTKIAPVYVWQHRPEMQFSVVELVMKQINRTDADGNVVDILPAGSDTNASTVPGLASSDQSVDLLYDLQTSPYDPLDPFGYSNPNLASQNPGNTFARDLVLALGREEALATFGANQTAIFQNPDHLSYLSPEDFLTLSLYQNSDSANILWEFAFETLYMMPWNKAGTLYVSADDTVAPLSAIIPGYINRNPDQQANYQLSWIKVGDGTLSAVTETNKTGGYYTTLTLPPTAGANSQIYARLEGQMKAYSALFEVIPGEPADITVTQTAGTRAAIAGIGQIELAITVRDAWGNLVADGTGVDINIDGDAILQADPVTQNGIVNAVIRGSETAGIKNVTIKAANALTTTPVTIDDIVLTITMPVSVDVDQVVPITISGSIPTGNLDGLELIVGTSKGQLRNNLVVFTGNTAVAELYTGKYKGSGRLVARVNGAIAESTFTVTAVAGGSLSSSVLVGDLVASGTMEMQGPDGPISGAPLAPYTISSIYTVTGTPGEVVPISLGTLADPVIEPVVDYSMRKGLSVQGTVMDRYELINATASNTIPAETSPEGFLGSMQFSTNSFISVPNHVAFDKASGVGFRLNVNPTSSGGTLVSNALRSQKLTLETDNTLKFEVTTSDGVFSVVSVPIALNAWHTIAAHYKNNQLLLEVDGVLSSAPATGQLVRRTTSVSLLLGGDFQGYINDFRFYNWAAPVLAAFDNGLTETTVTIDAAGFASANINSTARLSDRSLILSALDDPGIGDFFIKPVYAQTVAGKVPIQLIVSSPTVAVAFWLVNNADYALETGKAFLKGFFGGAGEGASTAEIVGDVISGFFLYGDVRDETLHSYWLATSDARYSKVIHALATIALLVRVAGPAGIAVGTAVSGAKTVAKLYRAASPFMKTFGNHLEFIIKKIKNGSLDDIKKVEPFLLLFAAIALDDVLREFVTNAIITPEDLDAWITYVKDWVESPPIIAQYESNEILDFLIKPTYAARGTATVSGVLKELLQYATTHGITAIETKATDIFKRINAVKSGPTYYNPDFYKAMTLRAMSKAEQIADGKGVSDILHHMNYPRAFADVAKDLDDLFINDIVKMAPEAVSGLKRVLQGFSTNFNFATGAAHQLRVIANFQRAGQKIVNVEALTPIRNAANQLIGMGRRYDAIVETATGGLLHIEAKAWDPTQILGRLTTSMNVAETSGKKIGENAGQLFKDIVKFSSRDNVGIRFRGVKWIFDERALDTVLTKGGVTYRGKDAIVEHILGLVNKNRATLGKHLGKNESAMELYIRDLKVDIVDFVEILSP